jgi:putative DNA primase/helicase
MDVIGTGRDDKDQYLILRWLAFGAGIPTTAAIPLADIGEREGWRTLKAGGVNVTTKSSLRAIPDWLQRSGSRELWRVVHATGWQCGAYIMPDGNHRLTCTSGFIQWSQFCRCRLCRRYGTELA